MHCTAAWTHASSHHVLIKLSMKTSPPGTPSCSFPASQNTPSHDKSTGKVLFPTTAEWHFKKDDGQSAADLVRKLQIQKKLTDVGASVQKLLNYSHSENSGKHVVRAEFETIPRQFSPTWRHAIECLDSMIACFSSLTEIHANNVYHGNPSIGNIIFQDASHSESGIRSTKGYLTNFHHCGHINGDLALCAKDVQIALSDFGGRLLMIAENSNFTKIRVLRMHLESQVNFADQDDLDALESASTMLNHLRSLKTLLNLRSKDYPNNHKPGWGPLNQEQVFDEYLELQQKKAKLSVARFSNTG